MSWVGFLCPTLYAQSSPTQYVTMWDTLSLQVGESGELNNLSSTPHVIRNAKDVETVPVECPFLAMEYFGDDIDFPASTTVLKAAISCDQATGAIKYIARSSSFAKLSYLRIDCTDQITEYIPHIAKLKSLVTLVLHVRTEQPKIDLSSLNSCESLAEIYCTWYVGGECDLLGFEQLGRLTLACFAGVGKCTGETVYELSRSKSLRALSVSGIRLDSDAPPMISLLKNLEILVLPGRVGTGNMWRDEISGLVGLKSLTIRTGEFDLAVIDAYLGLEELILGGGIFSTASRTVSESGFSRFRRLCLTAQECVLRA